MGSNILGGASPAIHWRASRGIIRGIDSNLNDNNSHSHLRDRQ